MTPTRKLLGLFVLLAVGSASAQESSPPRESGEHGGNLAADNLDRVAATAEQILEILNRDAGLMVELKRLFAEDAAAHGQLLEESDLTDSAVSERLRQDLHARVIGTRLLRRFGYLLPKLNPDSELAAQHNLEMRARAQELERTAQAREATPPAPQTIITVGAPSPAGITANQGRSVRLPVDGVDNAVDIASPPALAAPAEAHLNLVKAGGRKSLQSESPGQAAAASLPAETVATTAERSSLPPRPHLNRAPLPEFEPVRMDRRPNPYAAVPSLYDLYVQANGPSQKIERFGLEVFRNGGADPDILPMDLPVGPDYVVGPGDSLSINLWGGIAQRLLRTVDREGRLALPEAGPLLVSGKSLGEVQESVQRVLRTQFRDVSADVSLLRLRTVRVYVVGEISAPGGYDLSSLSTPLNAVFAAGGVTPRGSLRRLQHYRGNQLVEEVDGYDLLLHGIRGSMQRLENGDSLRVPPLGPSVAVDGMVRRPSFALVAFFAALFAGPCDLIYCSCPPSALAFAAYLLGLLKRAPIILKLTHLTSHGGHLTRIVKNKFFLPGALEGFVYSQALAVVCPCQELIDRLSGCGVPPRKLHLIPDWADTAELSAPNSSFRESHGIPSNAFLVVHSSSPGGSHDLRHFVCAAELTRDDPELFWLLVAGGEGRVSLEQEILRRHLANIRLLPLQSPQALAQMYAAADALYLHQSFPAADACIPSTLLACMSSGRAVVAAVTQSSEAACQLRAADCGILVPTEDPQALAQAIYSLRCSSARRLRLGRNARLYAEAHFSKARVLQSCEYLLAFCGFPVRELATGSGPSALGVLQLKSLTQLAAPTRCRRAV